MSVEKIESVMDVVSSNMTTKGNTEKHQDAQPEATPADIVSIGSSQDDITQIKWPPFFPIGDTQSIFKINK